MNSLIYFISISALIFSAYATVLILLGLIKNRYNR